MLQPTGRSFNMLAAGALFLLAACNGDVKDNSGTEAASDSVATQATADTSALPLNKINLPEGFEIAVYASGLENARSMAVSPNGTLFIGTRQSDKVYAVQDADNDGIADNTYIIASGLKAPNGVAFRDGDLYVAEISRLLKFKNIENNLSNPPQPEVIYDDYPTDEHHGWKYIAFGPDGKLYVPVGAPCNICESENEIYASITRMNPDGTGREIFAKGVRNTVGFTWDADGNLWFTDNNRDRMGDDMPSCELNKATRAGMHFGYPYCHAGDIGDPEFGAKFACSEFTPPAQKMGAHVAPLGLKFYNGTMFPADYSGHLFIAEHGSWDRSRKVGYKIALVKVENGKATSYETFADGWLNQEEQEAWGRPVDVLVLKDGSMLVSDDKAGVIYRITYKP